MEDGHPSVKSNIWWSWQVVLLLFAGYESSCTSCGYHCSSSKDGIHSSPKSVVFLVLSLTGSDTRMLNKSGSSYSGRKRTKTTTVSFAREGAGNAGKTG